METYIENLLQTLVNKKMKGKIDYEIIIFENEKSKQNENIRHLQIPRSIMLFYNTIDYIDINKPRCFEILPFSEIVFLNEKLLWFSNINKTKKICFDTSTINDAGEWDIVAFDNNYIITRTLASYVTNKLWAWVERERKIWDKEIYTK